MNRARRNVIAALGAVLVLAAVTAWNAWRAARAQEEIVRRLESLERIYRAIRETYGTPARPWEVSDGGSPPGQKDR